jgi:protein LSM14
LKFIGDFDFEKSNAEFDKNAIEDEIKKSLSIKTTKDKDDETTNTEKENKQEEEQQPQQPQQEQEQEQTVKLDQQQQEANPDGYYDKQKSFFDRISCETTEKEKTYVSKSIFHLGFSIFLFQ